MGSRTWIKIYCDKWISGTLRDDTPEVRGIWIDLLALAGSGEYGDTGEIKLINGFGLSDKQIAEILCVKVSLWRRAKQRLLSTNRIEISPRGAINITNWSKYQSEYDGQRQYRMAKAEAEPKPPFGNPPEKEKESDKLQLSL